jgi:hypothetical protein
VAAAVSIANLRDFPQTVVSKAFKMRVRDLESRADRSSFHRTTQVNLLTRRNLALQLRPVIPIDGAAGLKFLAFAATSSAPSGVN